MWEQQRGDSSGTPCGTCGDSRPRLSVERSSTLLWSGNDKPGHAETCTLSSIRECATLPAARGLATQRLTPRARNFQEIDMRPSLCLAVSRLVALAALLAAASGAQTVSTIYDFGANGIYPNAVVLTQGRDGRLYGTASAGGVYGFGTVFKQRTVGTGNVTIYNFDGGLGGGSPVGGVTLARDGNSYGTP